MGDQVKQECLSHNALRRILDEHARFNATSGKESRRADLGSYIIEDFDFSGLDLSSINARWSVFTRCRFTGCDLAGVYFQNSSLIEADFRNANLWKAECWKVKAAGACFDDAYVADVEFMDADLRGATFRNADLRGTSFSRCDLTNAIFDGADLDYASITHSVEDGTSWVNVKGRGFAA